MRIFGVRQVLLVAGYAIAYIATREISPANWQLFAGLRFAVLLFLPLQYWPAIVLGDVTGSIYIRGNMLHDFGWSWFAIAVLAPVLVTAVPVFFFRQHRWRAEQLSLSRSALAMVWSAGMAALFNALASIWAMHAITYSAKVHQMPQPPSFFLSVFLLGQFLGIMMVVPLVLTSHVMHVHRNHIFVQEMRRMTEKFLPTLAMAVLILACLVLMNRLSKVPTAETITSLLIFAPAIFMTQRQGWVGAISGTCLANLALQLTVRDDPTMDQFTMQVIMGLICTGLLLFGAQITEKEANNRILDREHKRFKSLARRNLMWGETRVRYTATLFERAFHSIQQFVDLAVPEIAQESSSTAIAALKWGSTGLANNPYRRAISAMRLETLETRGLKRALITGSIAQVLQESGIDYSVRVSGAAGALPYDLQKQLYRMTYETVMRFCDEYNAYRISVRIRVIGSDRPGVALVVKAWPGAGDRISMPPSCMELEEAQDAAETFNGIFHDRRRRRHPLISLLLRDF